MTAGRIPCLVETAGRRFADEPALLGPGVRISFRELDHCVSARASAPTVASHCGHWVALPATPTVPSLIEFLALLRAGARVLPVNPALPAEVLARWMARHEITRLHRAPIDLSDADAGAVASTSGRQRFMFAINEPRTGTLSSGSTGEPKVAVHSYRNHVLSAEGFAAAIPLGPGDRYLLALPWFHVGGLAIVFRCLLRGAAVVLGGRANDADFLRAMRITHVSMVETQLLRLLAASGPLPPLSCLLLGGGPVREPVRRAALERGLPVWRSYGLTETASTVIAEDPEGHTRTLPHRECRVADDGEILVRGATLFLGYLEHGRPVPNTDADGWFHTGDLGRWDCTGFHVTGRLDNRFVSGGENIQPEAIEAVLREHPAITEAVVVPRGDDEFGHRPVAFVDCTAPIADDALRDWLRPRLHAWLLPVAFHPLPRGDDLKIQRADLVRLAARPES